jgi:hypothetical protein
MYRRATHPSNAMSDTIQLQPTQLCDLLNYVLGRPHWHPIETFVVKTWHIQRGRKRVERWCEAILKFQGVLVRRKLPGSAGRPPCLVPPREIRGLCGSREIAQLQKL